MSKIIELSIPTHYPRHCAGCVARREQSQLALNALGYENIAAPAAPVAGDVNEDEFELIFECMPQSRKMAALKVLVKLYQTQDLDGKPVNRKKPDRTKTLKVTVPCDGQLAGEPLA